jgi:hypothetical protein
MSKIFSALLLALSLSTVACDDPDDKDIQTSETSDDVGTTGDDSIDTDAGADDSSSGTTDDHNNPGCLEALQLPPTGGPAGTLGDKC